MIFEQGFKRIEAATFDAKQLGATLRYVADMMEKTGAAEGKVTLGYDDGSAPIGTLLPEIVLRVAKKKPAEEPDD